MAAGEPILAQEHIESHYQVDPALFHPRADFLLRVQGMSMKNIGILDGDLLAVRRAAEARNGQIVVARIGNDVTVTTISHPGLVAAVACILGASFGLLSEYLATVMTTKASTETVTTEGSPA